MKLQINFIKRKLDYIVLATAILISISVLFAFVWPNIKSQMKLIGDIKELEQRRDKIANTLANLKATNYEQERDRLSGVNLLIPANNDFLHSLSLIEFLAQKNGLQVTSNIAANISQVNDSSTELKGYIIQSTFEGDYAAMKQFLQAAYQTKRAIGINSVLFNSRPGENKVVAAFKFFLPVVSTGSDQVISSLESGVSTFSKDDEGLIAKLQERSIAQVSTASASFGRQNPFAKP